MDLHNEATEIVIEINKKDENNPDRLDRAASVKLELDQVDYPDYVDCNSIKIEEVNINEFDDYDSITATFKNTEDNKSAVREQIENIKNEHFIDMDILYPTVRSESFTSTIGASDSPLKRIHDEESIQNGEPFRSTSDTKEHIKIEVDMSVDVKVKEQESETYMDSTTEVLAEELDIKPDYDLSNNKNCNRAAKKKVSRNEHAVVHREADKSLFTCYICNFVFHSKKDLIHHVGDCSLEGSAKKATISSNLAGHIEKHSESGCSSKQIPCIHCDKTFKKKRTLDDHVIKNHKEFIASVSNKIYQCKECSYLTTILSNLGRHMTKHPQLSVKLSPCMHCVKIFKSKKALEDHVIKKHKEFISSISHKIHQCKHCEYKTVKAFNLTSHMRKHSETGFRSETKRHPCIHCDAIFKTKVGLHGHIVKKHKQFIASVSSKINKCKYCSYETTNSLVNHMNKHPEAGIKQRTCSHCDKTFKSKRALDDHVIKKHRNFSTGVSSKIHACQHCSYKTARSDHLVGHMIQHRKPKNSVTAK